MRRTNQEMDATMTIITKRHLLKFYLMIGLCFLAFLAMGLATGHLLIKAFTIKHKWSFEDYLLILFCPGCIFLAFYTVVRYLKNVPLIVANQKEIRFNSEIFLWNDLEKIELTGKKPFKYLINYPIEGAALYFKNGQPKFIFDEMYSNSWQLKSFIEQVILNRGNGIETKTDKIDRVELKLEVFETFQGYQLFSFYGIMMWIMIGGAILLMVASPGANQVKAQIFISLFVVLWFTVFSSLMYYFALSDKYLAVKNHNFIWVNKVYPLNNIKEIVFEQRDKAPISLRVITKDYKNKVYPAGTLRNKKWLELKDKLESKGITVRNECI